MITALLLASTLINPPTEISGHTGIVFDDHLYVVGGMGHNNEGAFYSTLWKIDPVRAKWTALANMRVARGMAASALLDSSIYVAGGLEWSSGGITAVERFDMRTGHWTDVAPMHIARSRFCLVAMGGKLYAISGMNGDRHVDGQLNTTSLEEYEPAKNTWREAGNLRRARHGLAAIAWHDRIYVFGGYADDMTTSCEVWDPKTGNSTDLPPMPVARGFHGAVMSGSKMVCFGGRATNTHPSIFDPATAKWTEAADRDVPLNRFVAGVVGGKLWTVGGEGRQPPAILNVFDLATWK